MYSPAQWFDLTLKGDCLGQVIINKFYYAVGEADLPGVFGILEPAIDFKNIVLPKIIGIVSDKVTFRQIDVSEHVSGFAVGTLLLTTGNVGLRSGDTAPLFNAFAFKSQRTSREVPSAHKRFGAIAEGDVTNGVVSGGLSTDIADLSAALAFPFTATNGGTTDLYPVAISRVDTTVTPHVPRANPVFEATLTWGYSKVTSQVSRRP